MFVSYVVLAVMVLTGLVNVCMLIGVFKKHKSLGNGCKIVALIVNIFLAFVAGMYVMVGCNNGL